MCCKQKYATGVYTSGVVFEPRFYEGLADMLKEDELPIFNWVWFGLYRSEGGLNGYTYGMDVFGKEEMEVLNTDAEPEELRDFLASLASYVLACDVTLQDGETIGFSADDKHTITRSPGVSLPEEQMTLKIGYEPIKGDPEDDSCDHSDNDDTQDEEEFSNPEVYTEEEMEAVEGHIEQYFGKFENVFHELVSPDIHVDICVVPPSEERDYCTLVTMGMGAHRMNVPEELAEYKLERAELAIALPADWKLDQESMKDEKWYWPIRLLKSLARLPIASDTWLGFGHTMDNEEDFAKDTKLCAAILTGPQDTEDGSEVCILPSGEEVNFYQVIPLYRDELEYKLAHDADALLGKMNGISFVVEPDRQDAITRGTLSNDNFDGEMDDASYHLESIEEMLGTKLQGKYGHLGFKYKKSDKTLTRHSKNFTYMIAFSSFGGNTKDSISIEVCYIINTRPYDPYGYAKPDINTQPLFYSLRDNEIYLDIGNEEKINNTFEIVCQWMDKILIPKMNELCATE